MLGAQTGKPWKGLVASLILCGAGQFLSGARRRGVAWFAISYLGVPSLVLFFSLSLVPGKAGLVLLALPFLVWVFMLYDSYRPIRPLHWWGWALLVVTSLTLSEASSVALHRLFHCSHVPTGAMVPTIVPGDNILVSRCAYWFHPPRRGDIIVFKTSGITLIPKDPSGKEIMYDKRLVGLPGDKIEVLDPEIRINGVEMKFGDPTHPIEYHHRGPRESLLNTGKEEYIVPDGQYFVVGDNSANSFDSRYFGSIPQEAVYGKIVKIYWPFSRMSTPR